MCDAKREGRKEKAKPSSEKACRILLLVIVNLKAECSAASARPDSLLAMAMVIKKYQWFISMHNEIGGELDPFSFVK